MKGADYVAQINVFLEAADLYARKNADYGDAWRQHGITGILVRIGDKLHRHQSITSSGITLVNAETIRDTLVDLANYAAMGVRLIDEDGNGYDGTGGPHPPPRAAVPPLRPGEGNGDGEDVVSDGGEDQPEAGPMVGMECAGDAWDDDGGPAGTFDGLGQRGFEGRMGP